LLALLVKKSPWTLLEELANMMNQRKKEKKKKDDEESEKQEVSKES
jgi:hypothetical protein